MRRLRSLPVRVAWFVLALLAWSILPLYAVEKEQTAQDFDARGIKLYKEGSFSESADLYSEALALFPEDTLLAANAAVVFAKLCYVKVIESGDCTGLPACRRACFLEPNSVQWLKILGRAADSCHEDSLVSQAYLQALRVAPGDNEARWLLVQWYLRQGRAEEALTQCDSILGRAPAHAEAAELSGYLHQLHKTYGAFGLRQTRHLVLVFPREEPPSEREVGDLEDLAGHLWRETFLDWGWNPPLQTLYLSNKVRVKGALEEFCDQSRAHAPFAELPMRFFRDQRDHAESFFRFIVTRQVLKGSLNLGRPAWLEFGLAAMVADWKDDLDLEQLVKVQEQESPILLANLEKPFDPDWPMDFFLLAGAKSFAAVSYLDKFQVHGRWKTVLGAQPGYLDTRLLCHLMGIPRESLDKEVDRFVRIEY